ncbi:4'-phosphopantetheinyl transferase superfamily protein [Clostridium perfringens]|uniref:4'-phosphopantetheinyl transferase superfamily protein n=1 Tax=Clostridium perfringens TaxID=1502 RepID=UPI0013E3CF41|nr:4'-phosphopantetheinyl transferase superfamily protein [Clostridium perfringens]
MEVYITKINDIDLTKINLITSSINSEKINEINNFFYKKDKIRSLIGEILVRTIIIERLKINNEDIIIYKNKYGKPYLRGYPNFEFNLSHSGEYVVCAFDKNPVGIDIEKIKEFDFKEIAKNFFEVNELNYIINQDLSFQLSKFYEMWTLKESYIKCCGYGLNIPLNSFCIKLDKLRDIKVFKNNKDMKYSFNLLDIELNYKLAICSSCKNFYLDVINLNQNDLINKYFKLISN